MKSFLSVLVAGTVFSFAPAVLAVEWTKLTENSVGDKFFIDSSSIQRNGDFVWYWEYREFPKANNAILDVAVNQPLHGAVMRWSLDCTNKSQRLRKLNAYATSRQLIQKFDYGSAGMLMKPNLNSSGAVVVNYVCDQTTKPQASPTQSPQASPTASPITKPTSPAKP
jgi:hypothetical protein